MNQINWGTELLSDNQPIGLVVDGYLNLDNTQITHLPDGLVVVGWQLSLQNTNITHLPDNLKVGGEVFRYTKLAGMLDY